MFRIRTHQGGNSHLFRPSRRLAWGIGGVVALLSQLACLGVIPARAGDDDVRSIKVEREKPKREKHETVQFLRDNVAFLRSRIDALREKAIQRDSEGDELDPRYLAFIDMLEQREDAEARLGGAAQRDSLLESIADLAAIEAHLEELEQMLADQEMRLLYLHEDYVGHQQTSLVVLLEGVPQVPLTAITVRFEGGADVRIPFDTDVQTVLQRDGLVQLFHDYMEPREQWVELTLVTPQGALVPGYVELAPVRDRLNYLRFDISGFQATAGPESLEATLWAQRVEANAATQEAWSW